jgi:putative ABC transport system permease protein
VSLPATSTLSDTFFHDQTAAQAMAELAQHPDTILVSAETAKDYSLVKGDRVRIRVPDANGVLRTVDFRMGGVVDEFPTAPKDAFLVANLNFVAASTANDRVSFILARSQSDVSQASSAMAAQLGGSWHVADISSTNARLVNTVTSVDLGHLVQIDLGFAIAIASIGVALFLLAGVSERRRELATLRALGAEPSHLRSLLLGETAIVATVGVGVGLVVGLAIGEMLLQVLAGIFDPPAQLPAVPIAAVAGVIAAIVLGLGVALAIALRAVARLGVLTELRER